MLKYGLLDKTAKELWLPKLFDLYYENMNPIAPTGLSFEEERRQWLGAVFPALDKAPRQILLCRTDETPAGYIQYYTRGDLLMIEEVQLSPAHQRSTVFLTLIRTLIRQLPADIRYVEAYADSRNCRSINLMKNLGMVILEESEFVHLRGDAVRIRQIFTKEIN